MTQRKIRLIVPGLIVLIVMIMLTQNSAMSGPGEHGGVNLFAQNTCPPSPSNTPGNSSSPTPTPTPPPPPPPTVTPTPTRTPVGQFPNTPTPSPYVPSSTPSATASPSPTKTPTPECVSSICGGCDEVGLSHSYYKPPRTQFVVSFHGPMNPPTPSCSLYNIQLNTFDPPDCIDMLTVVYNPNYSNWAAFELRDDCYTDYIEVGATITWWDGYACEGVQCFDVKRWDLLTADIVGLWETNNPSNRIFNPTRKDDPIDSDHHPDANGDTYGTFRNKLYIVESPDGYYHVSLQLEEQTNMVYAVYYEDTKLTEGEFPEPVPGSPDEPADIVFSHPDGWFDDDIIDFEIRVGNEHNHDYRNGQLDDTEVIPLRIEDTGENVLGLPIVRGYNSDHYDSCLSKLDMVFWDPWVKNARTLLRIFLDDGIQSITDPDYLPEGITTSFDAYNDPFAKWLTHNCGASFNEYHEAQIKTYTWDSSKKMADLVAKSYTLNKAAKEYFIDNVLPDVEEYFADKPNFHQATFPLIGDSYLINHEDLSPTWVWTTPGSVTVDFKDPNVPKEIDDGFASLGRANLIEHKAKFTIQKRFSEFCVIKARYWGEVRDLYDFNVEQNGPGHWAAAVQIGNASRAPGRIFKHKVIFNQDVNFPFMINSWKNERNINE